MEVTKEMIQTAMNEMFANGKRRDQGYKMDVEITEPELKDIEIGLNSAFFDTFVNGALSVPEKNSHGKVVYPVIGESVWVHFVKSEAGKIRAKLLDVAVVRKYSARRLI